MKTQIGQVAESIKGIKGCQFASLTYLTKKTKELARYTVNLGFSYHNAVTKSVTELEIIMAEMVDQTALPYLAAVEVMESLKKTLTAHAEGKQNEDYTKIGQYISIGNGLNLNTVDNTIQLFGLLHSKVVLAEGEKQKPVKSAPLTIEKNKLRKKLSIGKFREFALDEGNVCGVKVNGDTIEFTVPESYGLNLNPPAVNIGQPKTETVAA
jgi:hypothetical protein